MPPQQYGDTFDPTHGAEAPRHLYPVPTPGQEAAQHPATPEVLPEDDSQEARVARARAAVDEARAIMKSEEAALLNQQQQPPQAA